MSDKRGARERLYCSILSPFKVIQHDDSISCRTLNQFMINNSCGGCGWSKDLKTSCKYSATLFIACMNMFSLAINL